MFSRGSVSERYDDAVYVRNKAKKIGKIWGIFCSVTTGLMVTIAAFASGDVVTVGTILLAVGGFVLGYLMGRYYGSMFVWTECWMERKLRMDNPTYLAMFAAGLLGLFIWLKYRKSVDAIGKEKNDPYRFYSKPQ